MSAFATAVSGAVPDNHATLAPAGANNQGTGVLQALGAIARYLPAEGIALYVALRSLLSPIPESWPAYAAAAAALALNIFIVATAYPKAATAPGGTFSRRRLIVQIVATVILTVVYVAALVGNPIDLSWDWQFDMLVTGALALVVAAALPRVAPLVGLVP